MTEDHLSALLRTAGAEKKSDGWATAPDGTHLTLYVACDGASMTVSKVEAVRAADSLLHARTKRGETYVVELATVFAGAVDGASKSDRKAGFAKT